MRFNTAQGKRTLADRSKYDPHQNAREKMRRVGQVIRGQIDTDESISKAVEAAYIDYATTKATGGDLTRFSNKKPVEAPKTSTMDLISDDLGGLAVEATDAVVPETGPDQAEGPGI